MTAWRIRQARLDDAEAIVALEAAAFGPASWGGPAVADGLSAPKVLALLACDDTGAAPSGFAFWRTMDDEAEILSIGVTPLARRRGCAHALLHEIVRAAHAGGVAKLFLEVGVDNAAALALYTGSGFQEIGRRKRYYRDGGDALVLRLKL